VSSKEWIGSIPRSFVLNIALVFLFPGCKAFKDGSKPRKLGVYVPVGTGQIDSRECHDMFETGIDRQSSARYARDTKRPQYRCFSPHFK
jgi:hypothetical protein